jgi:Ca2+-binding EF-hand superfamily protein
MGDLLRALGQNPTQAEVSEIVHKAPREGKTHYTIKVNDAHYAECSQFSRLQDLLEHP